MESKKAAKTVKLTNRWFEYLNPKYTGGRALLSVSNEIETDTRNHNKKEKK